MQRSAGLSGSISKWSRLQIAHDVAADRLGAERAAFHDLAHVPGERRIEAGADRHRRGRRGIVGAAAHHDVDALALVERLEERLGAHLRHDDGRRIDLALVERRHGTERLDAAGLELARDVALVDVGIDRGELEVPAALAGDIGDDVAKDIDMQVGAVAAGRGDQQGNLGLVLGLEQDLDVLHIGLAAAGHLAQPELLRAGVGRARIDGDGVRPERQAHLEVIDREAVAQHARRREDADLVVAGVGHRYVPSFLPRHTGEGREGEGPTGAPGNFRSAIGGYLD